MILFLQYLNQRKKIEAEEKRIKQRKARDDFLAMLEVSLLCIRKLSPFCCCTILNVLFCNSGVQGAYIIDKVEVYL